MTRPPGDDPAAFAIELETFARKAFVDVDASVRLQMVRDRFSIGQENRALRRHLDSVGPDTPISDIVDRCCVWESHDESGSEPIARHEPTGPRGVFQVTQRVSDEHNKTSTEPDSAPSEYEILAQRLREMAQQPVPGNRGGRDWTADAGISGSGRPSIGKRRLIRGGGLVTRISDNKEPQFDNTRKYREQPVRKKDTVKHEETMLTMGYDSVPRYIDSDESDSDDMLPLGAFWPAPEEGEWTMVERSHGLLRSAKDIDSDRLCNSGDKLDHSGLSCKQLDYIDWNDNRYDLNRLETL